MFNLNLGVLEELNGERYIKTLKGLEGHAVYGPYVKLLPGFYKVDFSLDVLPNFPKKKSNKLKVILDVCANSHSVLREMILTESDMGSEGTKRTLDFVLDKPAVVEFRVATNGALPLKIQEVKPCTLVGRIEDGGGKIIPFPKIPKDLRSLETPLRNLYLKGALIYLSGEQIIFSYKGIKFFVSSEDDLSLVGELIFDEIYRFYPPRKTIVIDVGMNIGIVSMLFAKQDMIEHVYAYEPFAPVYERALNNHSINPTLSHKITAKRIALSNYNGEKSVESSPDRPSGAMNIVSSSEIGIKYDVSIKDAAEELAPIINNAKAKGLDVVLKIDCEGSEYAVFDALHRAGLFKKISAVLCEWHAMFSDKTLELDLLEPLRQAGFLIIDRSPVSGNGMFYAVRAAF